MLLDNKSSNYYYPTKVFNFFKKYLTVKEKMNFVTGYFSPSGLARFHEHFDQFLIECNLIIGDLVTTESTKEKIYQLLSDNLTFVNIDNLKLFGRYTKISYQIEKSILTKVFSAESLIGELISDQGAPIFYRSTGGRYFKLFTPYTTNSTQEVSVNFPKKISNSIGAILSSSLFFWFYQIFSDNLHIKRYELESFKVSPSKLTPSLIEKLEDVYQNYLEDIEVNASIRKTEKYANISSFKEYKIGKSKYFIDKIDDLIGPLYDLSYEEIEFIKNYELNFRLNDHDH